MNSHENCHFLSNCAENRVAEKYFSHFKVSNFDQQILNLLTSAFRPTKQTRSYDLPGFLSVEVKFLLAWGGVIPGEGPGRGCAQFGAGGHTLTPPKNRQPESLPWAAGTRPSAWTAGAPSDSVPATTCAVRAARRGRRRATCRGPGGGAATEGLQIQVPETGIGGGVRFIMYRGEQKKRKIKKSKINKYK